MKIVLSILLLALSYTCYGQKKNNNYILNGIANVDTGKAILLQTGGKEFDPNEDNNYIAKIKKGKFTFEGKINYPTGYRILINSDYVSNYFIIEEGIQTIQCNVDSIRETPKINNKVMIERGIFLSKYITPVIKQKESNFDDYFDKKSSTNDDKVLSLLKNEYEKNKANLSKVLDENFLKYVDKNPNSYVALWKLVEDMNDGYRSIYDTIYSKLSYSIKSSITGKTLENRLRSSKVTAIGQIFPILDLVNINNKIATVSHNKKSQFTLVDFWFSRCTPCLQEFPKLIEIYNSYKGKGFSITGISIDKKSDFTLWKKTVKDKNINWNQFLDPEGEITTNVLSVKMFPSNFLLDKDGVIIEKNISITDLNKLLNNKLK